MASSPFTSRQQLRWLAVLGAAAGLSACGGSGSGASADSGTLRLAMTDSPACGYDHVWVTVTKIRVNTSSTASDSDAGWQELVVPNPRKVDLLSLTNGVLQELGSTPLPAGRYEQVRLLLSDAPLANSVVPSGSGQELALRTPSAQQSGYKLQAKFEVVGGQVADLVLDLDACRSVVQAGQSGQYNLKPVVAVTPRLTTQIEGYVDPALAATAVVSTRDPDQQLRATVPDPVTGRFVLAYLPENTQYTVVVTAPGRSTAAVTSVPVSVASGRTVLNSASDPISPPSSASAVLSGQVSDSTAAPVSGATVRAQQDLSSGQRLDVAWTTADPQTGQYSLSLPTLAPQRATYTSSSSLSFSADSAVAGRYLVNASSDAGGTQSTDPSLTLGATDTAASKNLTLVP